MNFKVHRRPSANSIDFRPAAGGEYGPRGTGTEVIAMRPKFVVAACALAAACWISPGIVLADEASLPETTATPADLVRAALKAELGGPSDLRKTLLDEALKRDPNFAQAR